MRTTSIATARQRNAARHNVKTAIRGAQNKRSIANMPKETRSALGRQAAAVALRRRTGGSQPQTRAELYEAARRRDIPGRSRMGRDELAAALGQR